MCPVEKKFPEKLIDEYFKLKKHLINKAGVLENDAFFLSSRGSKIFTKTKQKQMISLKKPFENTHSGFKKKRQDSKNIQKLIVKLIK